MVPGYLGFKQLVPAQLKYQKSVRCESSTVNDVLNHQSRIYSNSGSRTSRSSSTGSSGRGSNTSSSGRSSSGSGSGIGILIISKGSFSNDCGKRQGFL
jgi:hypothetical protein